MDLHTGVGEGIVSPRTRGARALHQAVWQSFDIVSRRGVMDRCDYLPPYVSETKGGLGVKSSLYPVWSQPSFSTGNRLHPM